MLGEDVTRHQICYSLNSVSGGFHILYLGFPLRGGKLHKDDWNPLVDRFDRRLAS